MFFSNAAKACGCVLCIVYSARTSIFTPPCGSRTPLLSSGRGLSVLGHGACAFCQFSNATPWREAWHWPAASAQASTAGAGASAVRMRLCSGGFPRAAAVCPEQARQLPANQALVLLVLWSSAGSWVSYRTSEQSLMCHLSLLSGGFWPLVTTAFLFIETAG